MDLYTYVATSNPYQSRAILHKYGYSVRDVNNANDLGICLRKLVTYEGEDALMDILNSHPDREVLTELNDSKRKTEYKNMDGGCDGHNCKCKSLEQYLNFAGAMDRPSKSVQQTSVFILAAALLLAAAIIVKK